MFALVAQCDLRDCTLLHLSGKPHESPNFATMELGLLPNAAWTLGIYDEVMGQTPTN